MDSNFVIKDFTIFEDNLFSFLSGFKGVVIDSFRFQSMEKTFSNRMITEIAFTAHTLDPLMLFDDFAMTMKPTDGLGRCAK